MGTNLIWIDLEMTGLDPERMVIIEIATVVTDDNLNIIADGPNIAINYPDNVLNSMEGWSMTQHKASGLLDRVKASGYNCRKAEQETLRFLCSLCKKGESPMCGNTIWQDRRFLKRYMPDLEEFFHYRMIDVSSIKELMMRWYPLIPPYEKKEAHLALMDIYECINELRYYRRNIFIGQTDQSMK